MIVIAPSILAANFSKLGEQVLETEAAGAQRIHVDVMDGHFVPNLSMGPEVVRGLRPITKLPLEVHLMVQEPGKFLDLFIEAGADSFLIHHEVLPDPRPLMQKIHNQGKKVGLAVNPETPVEVLESYLGEIDQVLCMTVHPGFSGQKFLPESPDRIKQIRQMIDKINPACELEVDGGLDFEIARLSVAAGANVLAIASAIFTHPEGPGKAVQEFRVGLGLA